MCVYIVYIHIFFKLTTIISFSLLMLVSVLFFVASKQMQKRIEQIVMDSFGAQFYPKAVDCLKTLRQQCIKVRCHYSFILKL